MNEVLMNDEDMALMYLTDNQCSSTARDPHQHQEIEMLFENYLLQVTWLGVVDGFRVWTSSCVV